MEGMAWVLCGCDGAILVCLVVLSDGSQLRLVQKSRARALGDEAFPGGLMWGLISLEVRLLSEEGIERSLELGQFFKPVLAAQSIEAVHLQGYCFLDCKAMVLEQESDTKTLKNQSSISYACAIRWVYNSCVPEFIPLSQTPHPPCSVPSRQPSMTGPPTPSPSAPSPWSPPAARSIHSHRDSRTPSPHTPTQHPFLGR